MTKSIPKSVRNFWIEITIDGRKEVLKAGPKSKNGGFSLIVYQRDNEKIIKTAQITGIADRENRLRLLTTTGTSTKR